MNQQGTGQSATLIAGTATLAVPGSPVARGSAIEIYATGLGLTQNPPTDGTPASSKSLSTVLLQPTVTIGGRLAKVLFAGLTPGTIGLTQINVVIPEDAPPGDAIEVVVLQSGTSSNRVTIAIR